jgi:bifunctional non-homologous end joining protein LigD
MLRLRSRPLPLGFIEPCLPTVATKPPSGSGWLHEIKHDGFRTLVLRTGNRVRVLTRNGIDWTERFPMIAKAAGSLDVPSCLIDGEIIAARPEDGLGDFDLLRQRKGHVTLIAFDLLEIDGEDIRRQPIEARKRRLAKLGR